MTQKRGAEGAWTTIAPPGRAFVKMHGLGNHFVIVDARREPFRPGTEEIRRLCDRRVGIGADQLTVIEPASASGAAGGAAVFARFWNTDGREAEACGNATRCVAWLLLEEAKVDEVAVETRAGVLGCRRAGTGRVRAEMGRILTRWQDIPLAREMDTCHVDIEQGELRDPVALNIGNPHLVFFVDDVDAIDLERLAPVLQADPLFPEQVNVGVAELLGPNRMRLRVYERGAGLTEACGSGACVAVFAALSRGLTDSRRVAVELPGGTLDIEISEDGSAAMTGPVEFAFSGNIPAAAE